MDATDPSDVPCVRHERQVTVPISFTGDVAGFLFDLLSDLEAIVSEADADTFAIEFINDRVRDLLGYEPVDVIAVPHFWREMVAHPDDREVLRSVDAQTSDTRKPHHLAVAGERAVGRPRHAVPQNLLCPPARNRDDTSTPPDWKAA